MPLVNIPVERRWTPGGVGLQLITARYNSNNVLNGVAHMKLKSMTIDALIGLRSKIDTALGTRVAGERRALETELARLTRFQSGSRVKSPSGQRAGQKVAPKYRNPDNSQETWAGRGLKPRWLAAALKTGKKLDDFAIAGGRKNGPTKRKLRTKRR
jgi:DNA-binding protein H-NS